MANLKKFPVSGSPNSAAMSQNTAKKLLPKRRGCKEDMPAIKIVPYDPHVPFLVQFTALNLKEPTARWIQFFGEHTPYYANTPRTFQKFELLPPEIRLNIWELVAKEERGRVISVSRQLKPKEANNTSFKWTTVVEQSFPGMLRACFESRAVILRIRNYHLGLGRSFSKLIIIDYLTDALEMDWEIVWGWRQTMQPDVCPNLRYLKINYRNPFLVVHLANIFIMFRSLEVLELTNTKPLEEWNETYKKALGFPLKSSSRIVHNAAAIIRKGIFGPTKYAILAHLDSSWTPPRVIFNNADLFGFARPEPPPTMSLDLRVEVLRLQEDARMFPFGSNSPGTKNCPCKRLGPLKSFST